MALNERIQTEQRFHDLQARQRALGRSDGLRFEDEMYLGHETWIRPAMAALGDVAGLRVLDFGCGHGMAAVVLARRGARVVAFDLSPGYLKEARLRARANGQDIDFVQADGEQLPLADHSFDRIWGNAILHHLDLERAARELARILRPGGLAVFCEPWGENPVLNWARNRLPYPGKDRTPDEEPLRQHHVSILRRTFPKVDFRGFQLLSMAGRVIGRGSVTAGLDWCDALLLSILPQLEQSCRYVVLTLRCWP